MKAFFAVAISVLLLAEMISGFGFGGSSCGGGGSSCGGGCGGGCGRKKRSIDAYEIPISSGNATELLCNDSDLRVLMKGNLQEDETASRLAIAQAIEAEGERFVIDDFMFAMATGMRMCAVGNGQHTCHAFEI